MPRILVTTLHRTADADESHGYLVEVDWDRKVVTNRIEAPPLWTQFTERARGGRRGLRGITFYNGLIWVASCDCLFGFSATDLQPERIISHPYMSHIHEIEAAPNGIWVTATNGDGVFLINEEQQILEEAWVEGAPTQDLRVHMETHYDRYHVNSIFFEGTNVFAYSARTGKVFKMLPGPVEQVAEIEKRCHNVARTSRGWVRNVSSESILRIGDTEIKTPVRGESGEFTRPGWLRGMAWLDQSRVIIGSSPATLLEIDVDKREVIAELQLEEDVGWTTHGIFCDDRPCSTNAKLDTNSKVGNGHKPQQKRGLGSLLGLLKR